MASISRSSARSKQSSTRIKPSRTTFAIRAEPATQSVTRPRERFKQSPNHLGDKRYPRRRKEEMSSDETYHIHNPSGTGYAIGHGAIGQYIATPVQQKELQDLFAELRLALAEHKDALEDPDALSVSTEAVEQELARDHPNRGLVKTLLDGIVVGAGRVTTVVEAVTKVQAAVAALL